MKKDGLFKIVHKIKNYKEMCYSLNKLISVKDNSINYDLINDSCDTHNVYDIKLNKFGSFKYDEWESVQSLFMPAKAFTTLEHDAVWNKLKSNGEF